MHFSQNFPGDFQQIVLLPVFAGKIDLPSRWIPESMRIEKLSPISHRSTFLDQVLVPSKLTHRDSGVRFLQSQKAVLAVGLWIRTVLSSIFKSVILDAGFGMSVA